jgi:hypothetical protein
VQCCPIGRRNLAIRTDLVLASPRMSGLQPRRAGAQPDQDSLPIGLRRYPTPHGGESGIAWAMPEPRPVSRQRLIGRWLASQAARPLAKLVAVGSAAGWVAAALVFDWTLVSGHALSAVTGAQPVADMALGSIDVGIGLLALSRRSPQSDRPAPATRRAMRRAQMDVGRRPGARASFWPRLTFLLVPSAAVSLPRPLRGLLAAGLWTSVLAAIWQFGAGDGGVQDQRLAASVWMMNLIVWCSLACRRLSLRHADASGSR